MEDERSSIAERNKCRFRREVRLNVGLGGGSEETAPLGRVREFPGGLPLSDQRAVLAASSEARIGHAAAFCCERLAIQSSKSPTR